ncbi:protein-L-isoaspartate O-methyltransferase domain-containing protein 1-like [Phymastichus coffea]|uniref:protein-L-isoaspartate O-methyltransferase domain-containing protein 1-like n=1 Tax=Phymastichus coffea TaxID=108790 RepID=UPI00273C2352|nr:protein-L-isoaspartate O-methyltransferase domain-containing protein 1-like [Phymastichus coffea]XP_058797208.1 protein-L-isoaspartate O-methyltransferase domain-containing protein 1-like [Phymastichus coffea]
MGGAFSSGQDNDELVDNLVDSGYIRSKNIEQVFRAVDRGDYFLSSHRDSAYKDFAWKHGNIHLSAPCIYCEVMEELALKPGLSFLNLGSGTGYLSTMVGLLLTQNGTNHGIELYEDCVRYSYDRLDEFKQKSLALDEFDFCEPTFVQGNCLSAVPGRRYDRVYCGATCPETHEELIKEFVKVGGILVMPYKDHLVKIKRVDESKWEQKIILPVSFTTLIIPPANESPCQLPDCHPLSLQELCRGKIRRRLRHNVWVEHTDLETRKSISSQRCRPSPPHQNLRQYVIPIFEESDENLSDDNEESRVRENQLLLSVDGPPGENLRTTLQFVRAVIRPNNTENGDNDNDEDDYINWPYEEESPSTEEDTHCDTNFSSERERQDSESSSEQDSACEKFQSEENNDDNIDKLDGRPGPTSGFSAYSNMSESESDQDDDNERNANRESRSSSDHQSTTTHRKKQNRRDKGDSGIVDDVCNAGNDEASFSSDSEFAHGTPVKHKRSSSSTRDNNDRDSEPTSKRSPLKTLNCSDNLFTGHYVDTNAFSSYMKEKIHQLPLPYSVKLYVNYNRNL